MICYLPHHPSLELVHLPKLTLSPSNANPSSPYPPRPAPGTHCLTLWVSMKLIPLGTSWEWNQIVFALLWLDCFTGHGVPSVSPCCSLSEFPSFWDWGMIQCANGPHFVPPRIVDRHLGCFTFWWLWAMLLWTQVCKYLFQCLLSFFEDTPGVTESFFFTFRGAARLSPQQLCLLNIPTDSYTVPVSSHSPYSPPALHFTFLFWYGSGKVAFHVVLICISLLLVMLSILYVPVGHLYVFLRDQLLFCLFYHSYLNF